MATRNNDPLYYQYYDKIYSHKNYAAETDTILKFFSGIKNKKPERILDVGCGSGTHSILFANNGIKVVGVDTDCDSIKIAKKKIGKLAVNSKFFCKDVGELNKYNFDLAVSLFNVITYINKLDDLLKFFKAIHSRLKNNGIFIFDCWNGLAAILDPPRKEKRKVTINNENIEIFINPIIDFINQSVSVSNKIKIKSYDKKIKRFSFNYKQTLWTPFFLREILRCVGFEVMKITTWASPSVVANEKDWKILFICQKKRK